MRIVAALSLTLCLWPIFITPVANQAALAAAVAALHVDAIKTIQFEGAGATFSVGQNYAPTDPWPRVTLTHYSMLLDYEHGSLRQELTRQMGPRMPRGGGVPFTGEIRQIQGSDDRSAWNIPEPANPAAGSLPVAPCTPPEVGGTPAQPAPAPESRTNCELLLWSTPHGFLKAAMHNHASTSPDKGNTTVSFTAHGIQRMVGTLDAAHHVTRVQAWIEQSIVGDMLVETDYSGYKDFGGVSFPSHIVQKQDGFPSLDLTVSAVTANPSAAISMPADAVKATPFSLANVKSQEVAEGVFWLTGGSHHSLAITMRDHIVLVDVPNGEERALAVIAKAKALIPGKPIRYVVAMHHHWDHMGGIRTAIDEAATIVTHETNRTLLERAAKASFTIRPDRLSVSKKALRLQTVGADSTLTDGSRVVELHVMNGFDHTDDMLLVYLPKEKLLVEADAYTPPDAPTAPLIAPKIPYAAALYDNIQRLKLDVRTIVPFHGTRVVDVAEVQRQAAR